MNKLARRWMEGWGWPESPSSKPGIKPQLYRLWVASGRMCRYCARSIPVTDASIDHYYPLSKGGRNVPNNRLLACKECNTEKSNAIPDDATPDGPRDYYQPQWRPKWLHQT